MNIDIEFKYLARDRFRYFYKRFALLNKKSEGCNSTLYKLIKEEIEKFETYITEKAKDLGVIDQTPCKIKRDIEKLFEYNISVTNDIRYNDLKISKFESMLSYYELKVSGIQKELMQQLRQYQEYYDCKLEELKKINS